MKPEDYAVFSMNGLRFTGWSAGFALVAVVSLIFCCGYAVGLAA